MPNQTALLKLPYPGPTDRPCDFDDQWCAFTGAVDAVFDRWEAGLNRAYPAIPAAKMKLSVPAVISNSNPILFTEVEFDTAGMTNMDADPYGITCQRAGRYTVAAFLDEAVADGGAGQQAALIISILGAFTEMADILILGAGDYRENTYWPVLTLQQGDRLYLTTFLSPQPFRTANSAWLSVAWHSDLARPS